MDEEDLQEAEESRQLQTSDTFSGFGTAADESRRVDFMGLVHPIGDTMGYKLLRQMGWREGDGIGAKVKKPVSSNNLISDGTKAVPPDDVDSIKFAPKNDRRGLGFNGNIDTGTTGAQNSRDKPQKLDTTINASGATAVKSAAKLRRTGFGVGVLNDDGSDDEDGYSIGPQISYNKVIGGEKKTKKKANVAIGTPNPAVTSKPILLSKKPGNLRGSLRKCHDDRLPLDGFVLGDEIDGMASLSIKSDQYKPPQVPAGWKSSYSKVAEDVNEESFVSVADAARSSQLNSRTRASALGETQLPGKSVFDFISPAARDKLVATSGKSDLPPGLGQKLGEDAEGTQEPRHQDLQDLVPKLDRDIALQALARGNTTWVPYGDDEQKRDRYNIFLEISAGLRSTSEGDELPPQASGMRQDDWIVEMQEFARAAEVFRPVTGLMASRFTSSGSGLSQSNVDTTVGTDELLTKPSAKPQDPAEAAASMGMFGPMTRSFTNFYPTRLLCKRFDVSMPAHQDVAQQPSQMPPVSALQVDSHSSLISSVAAERSTNASREPSDLKSVSEQPKSNTVHEVVDPDRNDALEQQRPNQELFKAVFGSDDDGDDEL